jgi:hypothetical protein
MPIHYLYGRRESLHGKAEAYKKGVRDYLESLGFSQTTDSSIQGTFPDMVYVNPATDPGKKFLVESKAEEVSLKSKKFARELVKYFRFSQSIALQGEMKFKLFVQGVTKPEEWDAFFSEINNLDMVRNWCEWYNNKCLEEDEHGLDENAINQISGFFAKSEVTVGSVVDLQHAALETQSISALSIARMAKKLLDLVNRRKSPVLTKSRLVTNILPIIVPEYYYSCISKAETKNEIYDSLKDRVIPPFLFTRKKEILTFSDLIQENPLYEYIKGSITTLKTKEFQEQNPSFSAQLVNIHLRRIFWNRGLRRDPNADIYYFPMLDKTLDRREVVDHRKLNRWVIKKIVHREDTRYHKKGEINFYFHRGAELRSPTYWGNSFVELIPRRYYTLDGENWVDGETRDKIDRKFRNPKFDRSGTRLSLMRLWKFILFESDFVRPAEKWFDKFHFGDFLAEKVDWSPQVIGRNQMSIWEYKEEVC